jgi:hypothetical protein
VGLSTFLTFQNLVVTTCATFFDNMQMFILTTECIYGFRMILGVNSDYFLKQR